MSIFDDVIKNGIEVAEAAEFESMTENQMSQILAIALEDTALEELTEGIVDGEVYTLEATLPEDYIVMEKSIVKLDKKAKKNRAYKLAILQSAKDAGDKKYKQLETLWKMEKFLLRDLEKKYSNKAKSRMKQTSKKVKDNNNFGKKVKSVLTRSEKETKKALKGVNKVPSQVKSQFTSITSKMGSKIGK